MTPVHSQRQRRLVIGCCALIAVVCAIASVCHVGLLPPKVSSRHLDIAAASARLSIDVPQPFVTNALAQDGDFQALDRRAALVGNLISSDPVLTRIAREAGIDPSQVAAVTRITTGVQPAFTEPDSERRAAQIAAARKPYQLEVQPSQTLPLLNIYTQAPTVDGSVRLANAVLPAVRRYLTKVARKEGLDVAKQVRLEQLGPARGAIVNGGARVQIAGLTFLFVFASSCLLALGVARLRRSRRGAAAGHTPVNGEVARRERARRLAGATHRAVEHAGDWPRTTRVMPWMVAVLIAIVFLVPFNDILLNVSLPIDLKFDRLVLPFIVGTWALMLAAGGPHAPKVRLTWIHVALGAVVAVAFLSLVLDARGLNQTLEFDTSIKKLTLLASYVSLFVVVASVVRRTEVHAFMTLTLLLSIATALGMILEFRFEYNPFYSIADGLLPGIFQVGIIDPSGIDEIGRRAVQGPAQVPLEAVAMLAMALPIALVRLLQSERTRERIWYAVAAAVLLAAMVATFRKTAFLAPISVCLTLAYFRRRELIKLAPLGIVLVLVIQVLSPGALSAVAGQLDRKRLGVTTVSDRTADYDAIRPDVWSHLAFGRGYGSYEHTSYRVLDMELLRQLIEVGVIGLLAYIMLVVAVVGVARGPIRARRRDDTPVALAVAAAAVCFLVVSTLFDVMSFPHVPYLFLWMAALLAVMCGPKSAEDQAKAIARTVPERVPSPAHDVSTPKEPAWSS
jgi:hypothetical protein